MLITNQVHDFNRAMALRELIASAHVPSLFITPWTLPKPFNCYTKLIELLFFTIPLSIMYKSVPWPGAPALVGAQRGTHTVYEYCNVFEHL